MADVATTTAADAAPAGAAVEKKRPEKPDEAAFEERKKAAEKEHADVMEKFKAVKAKIELAQPSKDKDTQNPTQKRRQELITQLGEIRTKQGAGKTSRTAKQEQIKRLDEQLRSRINEQKNSRSKVAFKSVEDLDREIDRLDKEVSTGRMKLVDEKKALTEISNLRKQRKTFGTFDTAQKGIDEVRAKIKEIKDSLEDPESKALSEQYNKLQAELDAIKAEQDEAWKGLSSLRDERTKLNAEQQEKWQAIRKINDDHWAAKRAYMDYDREQRNKARERQRAERDRIDKERKKERAQKMLQEASDPAYLEEIRRANSLLHFFDPSSASAEKAPLLANRGLSAEASRKVDDAGMKGTRIVSKKDNDDEYVPAAKKGKKGKKGGVGASAAPGDKSGFNLPPSVIDDATFLGIDPPMNSSDVPAAVEKIKAKLDHWKSDQAAQTQKVSISRALSISTTLLILS
jgi:uncharacterized coiled-coil DUF342 family protein